MKICKKCITSKDTNLFYVSKTNTDGREGICISCRKKQTYQAKLLRKSTNPDEYRLLQNLTNKRSYDNRPGVRRRDNIKSLYGITQDWYDRRLEEQRFVCDICKKPKEESTYFNIDHNHLHHENPRKGCVICLRGLLCDKCNRGLGNFYDNINNLQNAIEYLVKYGTIEKKL